MHLYFIVTEGGKWHVSKLRYQAKNMTPENPQILRKLDAIKDICIATGKQWDEVEAEQF